MRLGESLVFDLIILVLLSSPFLFLAVEFVRTGDKKTRFWLMSVGVLVINQILSFQQFRNGIPLPIRMGLNNAAYFLMAFSYLRSYVEPSAKVRSVLLSFSLTAITLLVVAIMLYIAGYPVDLIVTLQVLWIYSFTAFVFWLFMASGITKGRFRFYAMHISFVVAFTLYSEIFIFQIIRILGALVGVILLGIYLANMHLKVMNGQDRRIKNLRHVRDIIVSVMHDIGTETKSVSEVNQTLEVILKKTMNVLTAQAGAIYLIDPRDEKLVAVVVQGYFPPLYKMAAYATTRKDHVARLMKKQRITLGEGLIGELAVSQENLLIENGRLDDRITAYGKDAANINTMMASPLKVKDDMLGLIVVVNKENNRSFNEFDSGLFSSLAMQAAVILNNARMYANLAEQERMKREFEFAKRIQQNLLPKQIPEVHGIQLAGQMIPALEVSGDYFDFIKRTDDRVNIIIGDVSGKGIPAGMIMLMVRTVLHAISDALTNTKDVIVEATRLMMPNLNPGEFMTLIYLDWDSKTKTMTYTSAGHEHIVVYRAAAHKCEIIMSGGIAIGMYEEITDFVEEKQLQLEEGDVIVLYTDGITEALNARGHMYGLDALSKVVDANATQDADTLKDIIYDNIKDFIGDTPQHDDITMVVAKIE